MASLDETNIDLKCFNHDYKTKNSHYSISTIDVWIANLLVKDQCMFT